MLYCQPLATPHNVAKQWNGKRKVRIYTENTTLSQAKHKFFNKGGTLAGILLKVSRPAIFKQRATVKTWPWELKRDYLIMERWELT